MLLFIYSVCANVFYGERAKYDCAYWSVASHGTVVLKHDL
jgi:hypothetical protein